MLKHPFRETAELLRDLGRHEARDKWADREHIARLRQEARELEALASTDARERAAAQETAPRPPRNLRSGSHSYRVSTTWHAVLVRCRTCAWCWATTRADLRASLKRHAAECPQSGEPGAARGREE